jgi:hypothetical protein
MHETGIIGNSHLRIVFIHLDWAKYHADANKVTQEVEGWLPSEHDYQVNTIFVSTMIYICQPTCSSLI